jgi:putative transposase
VLGLWFQASEGAKFWLQVLGELKQRGVRDVLICCGDGLKGFSRGDRGHLPADLGADLDRPPDPPLAPLRPRQAPAQGYPGPEAVLQHRRRRRPASALNGFEQIWGERYPMIGKTWREAWGTGSCLAFPRRGSPCRLNHQARSRRCNGRSPKTIKTRGGHFPTEGRQQADLPRHH